MRGGERGECAEVMLRMGVQGVEVMKGCLVGVCGVCVCVVCVWGVCVCVVCVCVVCVCVLPRH